ncbi:hypothetical protein O7631_21635 [Micromonospora sp. WMMD967]|uniref:hypothetical protein n=1 Tax=Micromonospora sp. WMMD967 TaxID=3016101 RepID=UPI002417A66D|nr:hypothetical protein [Micromonospora sp. WMMD967]MDG4839129.1 hypothetical protein [Micromonospora sp. WMMD967]
MGLPVLGRNRRTSRSTDNASTIKEESVQFLLADFVAARELRVFLFSAVEKRVQFVVTLQAAEMAFVGVLLSQRRSIEIVISVALGLGVPTLFLTYLAYRRALDMMIQARKYIRAMNAIRGFFVANDPLIAEAVLLPASPRLPRFDRLGHGGSPVQTLATTVLVLVLLLSGLLVYAVTWLISGVGVGIVGTRVFAIAAVPTAVVIVAVALVERRRMRRLLQQAEAENP